MVLSKSATFKFLCEDILFGNTDLEASYCSSAIVHPTYFSLPFPHTRMFRQHTFSICKILPKERGRFPTGSHPTLDELATSQSPLPLPPLDLPALPTPLCLAQHPRPPPHISDNPRCDIYIEIYFLFPDPRQRLDRLKG